MNVYFIYLFKKKKENYTSIEKFVDKGSVINVLESNH